MVVNLGNAEKKNEELKKEITALKQIQNNQSKALQKMVFQNDYPQKIKALVDELKYQKDRFKDLDDENKKERKLNFTLQEQVIQMKETLRGFKTQSPSRKKSPFNEDLDQASMTLVTQGTKSNISGWQGSEFQNTRNSPKYSTIGIFQKVKQGKALLQGKDAIIEQDETHGSNFPIAQTDSEIIQQLQRQNGILLKSKESMMRKHALITAKLQKKIDKLIKIQDKSNSNMIDKEKELKTIQVKLREFLQRNMKMLEEAQMEEIENIIDPSQMTETDKDKIYNKLST